MNFFPVHQFGVDITFPKIIQFLKPAIEHNQCSEWTLDAVYAECMAGRMLLFVDDMQKPNNVLVGKFVIWSGQRVFYIAFMGGIGGEDWQEAMRTVREFVERFGVTRISANLRDGWMRYLKVKKLVTLCDIEA